MSVRVHAITGLNGRTPEYSERFNYTHDEEARNYLENSENVILRQFFDGEGSGEAEITIQGLNDLLSLLADNELSVKLIKADIDILTAQGETSITYFIF
ncbi:MAG: hypothetical protein HPY53_01635 [Brevinematales bacterium]|nr:hypothetical protein [Brevinematales bacterium]